MLAARDVPARGPERRSRARGVPRLGARGGLEAYDQKDELGFLRHLVVREGIRTGEVLCVLVTSPGPTPDFDELERLLAERCPTVVGVLHAVNEGVADSTPGLAARVVFGRGWFEEEILGLRLRVSAGSFLQTNTEMTDLLYGEAVRRAALTGREVVWDLYSGIGSIALALAGGASRVIGVEIVEEAVERARENALLNGVGKRRVRGRRCRQGDPAAAGGRACRARTSSSSTRRGPA